MSNQEKVNIGFFVKPEVKTQLQKLAMEHNRTLSGELTTLIEEALNKMEKNNGNK